MTTPSHSSVLESLAQAARSSQLLIFVGAGMSADYGLPTWLDLARELNGADVDERDLPAEFSKFVLRHGLHDLNQILERRLGMRPTIAQTSTKLLLETRSAAIVTTNCDRILETAAKQLDAPMNVFVDDGDLVDFYSTPFLRLVKLHGTLDRKETMIFTREQYESRLYSSSALERTVLELMNHCRVLFLGYSMSDPDFFKLMKLTTQGHPDRMSQMTGLFSSAEINGSWRRIVLDENVRVSVPLNEIPYEDFGETPSAGVTGFLRRLSELVSPRELPRLTRQCIIFTNGYTATLKTEVAAYLANCLGVPVIATHRYGGCTTGGILDTGLRDLRYAEMIQDARGVVERGHSVILDGTFADPHWRAEAYRLAIDNKAHVIVLKNRCDDESYIRARLWRRKLDHSRSEHEVTKFLNFLITHGAIIDSPFEKDAEYSNQKAETVLFENHGNRTVTISEDASADARILAELIRISPFMSPEV